MYKVVVSSLFIDGKKFVRGDMLDITEDQARMHGTRIELAPKPKRAPRKKKVVKSED